MADGTAGLRGDRGRGPPPLCEGDGAVRRHQLQPILIAGPAALMGWDGRKGTVMWARRSGLGFAFKGSLARFSLVFLGTKRGKTGTLVSRARGGSRAFPGAQQCANRGAAALGWSLDAPDAALEV